MCRGAGGLVRARLGYSRAAMREPEPHRARARAPLAALLALATGALAVGCVLDVGDKHACARDGDCLAGRACVSGRCQPLAAGRGLDGGAGGAMTPGGDAAAGTAADANADLDAPSDDASDADASDAGDGGDADLDAPPHGDDADASGGNDADAGLPLFTADGTPNYMFVTSGKFALTFGSLQAADALCDAAAKAGGLPGTFRAWLSTGRVAARDRLGAARGWIRPDGAPFADTVLDIVGNRIFYPPYIDERGHAVRGSFATDPVVTGTSLQNPGGSPCQDWTSADKNGLAAAGVPYDGPMAWTDFDNIGCDATAHLYCFGIDYTTPLQIVPQPGKRAFVTEGSFLTTGLDGADRLCAAEAQKAGLTGSFAALLATTVATAASRFPSSSGRWVRVDGVPLVEAGQDFLHTGPWAAPLCVTGAGAYIEAWVMTGAGAPRALAPDLLSTCINWQDTGQVETLGIAGITNHFDDWFDHIATPDLCHRLGDNHVYCLEQ
jgi:hypothetical protein